MEPEGVISTSTVGRYTVAKSWELTPRMISAFAAGVDDPNPAYLDDTRPGGLVGHPGLVFTFQWNSRHILRDTQHPDTTRRGVHASIDARFARAFAQNDAVTSQGRTIAVRQIVPGVFITQRFMMRDSEGADIAVVDFGSIIRGARTDGPDASVEPDVAVPAPTPQPPEAEPVWVAHIEIARTAAHTYTECADIWNPIHTERSVALAAGLPDIILHGSATLTIALREVVNRGLDGDPTRVTRLVGQLRAMVIPGEYVTVRCWEDRTTADGGREIFYDVLNQAGQPAVANGVVVSR